MPGLSTLVVLSTLLLESITALRVNIAPRGGVTSGKASFGATRLSSAAAATNHDESDISNVNNQRYTANITINHVEVPVTLDTGSTDLWYHGPTDLGTLTLPNISTRLEFGDGSAFLDGEIAIAPVELGGYTVRRQAFLNAKTSSGFEGDFKDGIYGLLGLSFDSPGASRVNDAVLKKYGASATWGQSTLANIFDQNPDKENFIGLSLSRTDDLEDTDTGSLDIGEYPPESEHANVAKAPHLAQFPKNSGRWSVLLDGITIDGVNIPLKSVAPNVPAGKLVSVLDSGTTNVLLAPQYINAIYGSIPGAKFAANSSIPPVRWSGDKNAWVVPCMASSVLIAEFGGEKFPLHPLDLTDITTVVAPDGKNYTVCLGAFTSIGSIGQTTFDALWGASFLRNTYTVFDFGDSKSTRDPTGSAFLQLVSETNADDAVKELKTVRGKTLQGMHQELAPEALIALFDGKTAKPSTSGEDEPTINAFAAAGGNDDANGGGALINKWAPVVVGLLGANLFIGLVLIGVAVVNTCVRRGGLKGAGVPSYSSVPYKD